MSHRTLFFDVGFALGVYDLDQRELRLEIYEVPADLPRGLDRTYEFRRPMTEQEVHSAELAYESSDEAELDWLNLQILETFSNWVNDHLGIYSLEEILGDEGIPV